MNVKESATFVQHNKSKDIYFFEGNVIADAKHKPAYTFAVTVAVTNKENINTDNLLDKITAKVKESVRTKSKLYGMIFAVANIMEQNIID